MKFQNGKNIKESSKTVKKMERVFIFVLMVTNMTVNGKMIV